MTLNLKRSLPLAVALCVAAAGCNAGNWSSTKTVTGSGNVLTQDRPVSGFDRVHVNGSGELTIIQDDRESLTITTDDNLLPLIRSEVSNGLLLITPENVNLNPSGKLHYELHLKNLKELRLSGSLKAVSPTLHSPALEIVVSGSGSFETTRLRVSELKVQISGSGKVALGGSAERQSVQISGSGDYHAGHLDGDRASIHVSGSGNATVRVDTALDANVSGSGDIGYIGTPQVNSNVSGSGRVHSLRSAVEAEDPG